MENKDNWRDKLEKIVEGRQNSKYHKNYIAIHIVKSFISQVEQSAIERTEKAFGGCKKCFGKGYATTLSFASSQEDFGDEKTGTWKLPEMRFCVCDRGKQLKEQIAKNIKN